MSDEFKEALRKAADEAVRGQLQGIEFHLRQAFYQGVDFEMNRSRTRLSDALAKAKTDNTPS